MGIVSADMERGSSLKTARDSQGDGSPPGPLFKLHSSYSNGVAQVFSLFRTDEDSRRFLACALLCRNSKTLLSGGFGSGKNTFVEIAAKVFFGENLGIVRCHPELTVFDIMWNFDVQRFIGSKIGAVGPRKLITAPFKYLNEIQRLNVQCQNALLSLLTDRTIMFGDATAETPDYVCFLDRNPRDIGTIGIVKALIDRIDYYLDVMFLGLKETLEVLETKYQNPYVGDLRFLAEPALDAEKMQEIWTDVERVQVSEDIFIRLSLIGILLRKCVRADRAVSSISYKLICDGCPHLPEVCNKLERPLGHRWIDSSVKLAKASAWLDKRSEITWEDILWTLPFTLPHRLELKQILFTKFENEAAWVREALIHDVERKQQLWDNAILCLRNALRGDHAKEQELLQMRDQCLAVSEMCEWVEGSSSPPRETEPTEQPIRALNAPE